MNEDITNFHGFGKTNPLLAAILTGSLLSMAGIPCRVLCEIVFCLMK
jgi:NADH:ubiquinone oxidoreductase subunit 2 (subunit N)